MSVDILMDKIIVNKNFVKFNNMNWKVSNEEEIREIISSILMDRVYNTIHVYKRCPGSGKPAIKSCIFYDETGLEDLLIISDKQICSCYKRRTKRNRFRL